MRQVSRVSIEDVLYVFIRDKRRILLVLLLSVVGTGVWLAFQDSIYVAETRVLVRAGKEKLAGIEPLARDNYNMLFQERGQDIHNGIEMLKEEALARAVFERLRPMMQPSPPPESWFKRLKHEFKRAFAAVKDFLMRPLYWLGFKTELSPDEQAVRALRGSLQVEFIEDTDMIRVGFGWPDPQFAAIAANAFASEFLVKHARVHENPQSEEFYRDQSATHEKKLAEAEAALARFRGTAGISNLPLQKEMLLREMTEIEARLNETNMRYEENRVMRETVAQMLKQGPDWIQTPEIRQRAVADFSALDRQYFELVARRSQLAAVMADGNPELQQTGERMTQLRQSKGQNVLAVLAQNINTASQERTLLRAQLDDRRARVSLLNQRTGEIGDLERARTLAETTLLAYRKKVEELRVSDLLSSQRITGVRVVSEAAPPVEPAAPRRGLIMGLAALIGLLLGVGYSAVAQYFNHTFRSRNDVERILGVRSVMQIPMLPRTQA